MRDWGSPKFTCSVAASEEPNQKVSNGNFNWAVIAATLVFLILPYGCPHPSECDDSDQIRVQMIIKSFLENKVVVMVTISHI